MQNNQLIAGWVYKNGELARKRLDNFTIGLSAILGLLICITITWFLPKLDSGVHTKIESWIFVILFFDQKPQ